MAFYSIGHSNLPADSFLRLLQEHQISLLADVRSRPYSRFNPQFNKAALASALESVGIEYRWSGLYLGGLGDMPTDCTEFVAAMDELIRIAKDRNVAIMCAERLPEDCHRQTKLGTWAVRERGVLLNHIVPGVSPRPIQASPQKGLFDQ